MDKGDVEMEDARKQPQEGLTNESKSEEGVGIPGAQVKKPQGPELPSTDAADGKKPSELEGNAELAVECVVQEKQSDAKVELQDAQMEVDEPTNIKGDGDHLNIAKVEEVEDGSFTNGVEVDNQNKAKVQTEETNKDTDDVSEEPKKDKDGASDQPNKDVGGESEEDNMGKGEEEVQPTAKTKMKDQTNMGSAPKEETSPVNDNEVEETVGSVLEDEKSCENAEAAKNHSQNGQLPFQLPVSEIPPKKKEAVDDVPHGESEEKVKGVVEVVHQSKSVLPAAVYDDNVKLGEKTVTKVTKAEVGDAPLGIKHQPATPDFPVKYSSKRSGSNSGEAFKNVINDSQILDADDGTPEEQAAFIKELESFYRERGMDFKPPKFYGQPLNLCKLWRSVIRLGGYDRVTGSKLWRQVGESFHPPKTCTTVSWTFRIFYEKSVLEYERYKIQSGELQLPVAAVPESAVVDNEGNGYQASGSGRARRDAAARAMQGWHVQRHFGYGEVGEPIIKDKSPNNLQKRENKLKSIGSLKQKRPSEIELPVKAQKTEAYRQLVTTVVDVGPPADWVKINVRETKDCFEVYALVPGLLREEVRVQSDPAGRLVITGQPEQPDNPWGITAFKKVVSLPGRIDPLQTSAVVSLHGRLFVRVPFEQANI
ncbi:hypothetical protein ACH5RR_027618 [Cinchona calisaya]|uniref:AT-rich interactive domain-containing protein 5 n=1 Tax=Cinchona calisaya TaxID=153742 RepID=A0ABD2Z7U9_9GENT